MNQQNAFDRIAELEAKLKIATENCAQAVKERNTHFDQLSTATTRLQHAYRLLHNVVIKDGCGSWTTAERDAWASSYKGFMNGQSHIERDFELQQAVDNCGQMVKEVEASRMALVLVRERLVEPLERRLQAAEAVCERVDSLLTPSFDATMDDLLSKWLKLKEKQ